MEKGVVLFAKSVQAQKRQILEFFFGFNACKCPKFLELSTGFTLIAPNGEAVSDQLGWPDTYA